MDRVKTVVPDDFPIAYGGPDHPDLALLRDYGEVAVYNTQYADRAEFFDRIADAEAIINVRAYSKFDQEAIERAPKLKIISILGTGTDNVDLAAAGRRGIVVTNTPAVNSVSVAELAMGLMFAAVRQIPFTDRGLRQGIWQRPPAFELQGKTLGLLGLGVIGAHLAMIGRGIGMHPIAWSWTLDPDRAAALGVELVERDELFRRSDVISVHLRNTPEARGLVGRREFDLMKPTAVLVNTARAPIVDQDALLEALRARRIHGAALDVFLVEPLPLEQNPFKDLDNVVITPHNGGGAAESVARTNRMPVDNIIAFLEGRPEHVVNTQHLASPSSS
jgi:D-3-phosphoglycerate dehydrogenase